MKSSLTMTLSPDSNPAIKMYYEQDVNDDLRDRVFSMFREKLGLASNWCTIEFAPFDNNSTLFIEPITPVQIVEQILRMENVLRNEMPEAYNELISKRSDDEALFSITR